MTGQQKYDLILQILTDSYVNGTLKPGNGCGCLVGNLIAHSLGINIYISNGEITWHGATPKWAHKFWTSTVGAAGLVKAFISDETIIRKQNGHQAQMVRISFMDPSVGYDADWQLAQVGLPTNVLMDLEWTFEINAARTTDTDEKMFLGLMAALDYLAVYFELPETSKVKGKKQLEAVFN